MTRRPLFPYVATLALAVLLAGSATAQPAPPQGPGPGQEPRMAAPPPGQPPLGKPPAQGPQLTDEQLARMQALATEQRDRVHAARDQMQKLGEQMRAELWADRPDEAKITQLRGDLARAQQEMFAARLDFQAKRALILTPEQRKQVRQMQMRRQAMGRGAFAPRQRFGPAMRGFRGGMRGFRGPGPWGGPGPVPPGPGYGRGWRWWSDEP